MSLKKNIIANHVGQIYSAATAIIVVPIYLEYLGAESYGLIGFFATLQIWFGLLDIGLTPSLSRESAKLRAGTMGSNEYRELLRSFELFLYLIAIVGCVILIISSNYIATEWLKPETLDVVDVRTALNLMALIIGLRLVSSLYKSVMIGLERFVQLSIFNISIVTIRFVFVIPLLAFCNVSIVTFFLFQLAVSILEWVGIAYISYKNIPRLGANKRVVVSLVPLKKVYRFALTIGFTSIVWVLISQLDKLVLSKVLLLVDFSYFTIATLAAGAITMVVGPLAPAVMPRLVMLEAKNDADQLLSIYVKVSEITVIVSAVLTTTLVFCAKPILYFWTGNEQVVQNAEPILILYSLGNGAMVIAGLQYLLQYAKGNLDLHLYGNIIFSVIFAPLVVFFSMEYGAFGAGCVWFITNLFFFCVWTSYVHHKVAPGLNKIWFKRVFYIIIGSVIAGAIMSYVIEFHGTRISQFIQVAIFGVTISLLTMLCSTESRRILYDFYGRMRDRL